MKFGNCDLKRCNDCPAYAWRGEGAGNACDFQHGVYGEEGVDKQIPKSCPIRVMRQQLAGANANMDTVTEQWAKELEQANERIDALIKDVSVISVDHVTALDALDEANERAEKADNLLTLVLDFDWSPGSYPHDLRDEIWKQLNPPTADSEKTALQQEGGNHE